VPTILSHLAPPLAMRLGFGKLAIPGRLLFAGLLASILPDLDVLAFRLHIPYSHVLGHRGFSHSLLFALGLATLAVAGASLLRSSRPLAFIFVGLAALSHPLLDMITNGGLGVALWWPWSSARVFAPWQVIEVSPLSLHRLLGPRGIAVIESELLWVWLPALLAGLALLAGRWMAGPGVAPETLERRLAHRPTGIFIFAAAGLWLAADLGLFAPADDHYLAHHTGAFSALLLPALFALGGALLHKPLRQDTHPAGLLRWLLPLAVGVNLLLAYALCAAIIDKIARIGARLAYEGNISLSFDTALLIASLWASFAGATYALHRWAPLGLRSEFLSRAALALVVVSSLLPVLYMLNVTPYLHFRS
jgi:inner membrane protein